MKKLLISAIAVVFLFPSAAYAVACVSNGTGGGNWSDEATWTDASCGAAHFPISGDSATIAAGDTVTIDGDLTVGTSPASAVTYDLDISGTLYWPNNPGIDMIFTLQSSMRINAGGIFQIGDSGTPLNSAVRAHILFNNTSPVPDQKYKILVNGGKLYVYGNSSYFMTSGANYRARIFGCIPDCNAGAGRTIMLDRAVYWPASASLTHDAILIGIGGNVSTAPAAGDDGELITSWGSPGSSSINGVTLTENHMIGDIVVNVSRNVLFQADSATYHSIVETTATNNPYDINYARFDEFGDNTTTGSGITFNAASNTVGTINHVSVTNCEDGAGTTCFYINSSGWTKFEGNTAYESRSTGNGFYFLGNQYPAGTFEIKDCTYIEGPLGNGDGIEFASNTVKTDLTGFWSSNANSGIKITASYTDTYSCILHATTTYGVQITSPNSTYYQYVKLKIDSCEIRNSESNSIYLLSFANLIYSNNDIDGAEATCFNVAGSFYGYFENNTYDRCNTSNTTNRAGFEILNSDNNFDVYAVNESFGATTANNKSNINIDSPTFNDTITGSNRYVCNNCLLAEVNNPITCSSMPTDGIIIPCLTYNNAVYIPEESFYSLHNKDQVENANYGWGPGGMVFTRETVTVVDNTLNVKVQPGNATDYGYLPLGTISVVQGQTVTVNVQIRKDESQSAGFRPRLGLEGAGFNRYTTYDEMSDAINTWETVTVTGVATYSGSVHIYLGVKNNLSGANNYEPEWPPTLEIYADGISVTKTGP
ncbi:MAG: G8 domain-containing protein [Candidatus Paceibacterota bacterium]